jgi:hypothetical protein
MHEVRANLRKGSARGEGRLDGRSGLNEERARSRRGPARGNDLLEEPESSRSLLDGRAESGMLKERAG